MQWRENGRGEDSISPLNDCLLRLSSLKVPTRATYIPPAILIYLPDPLNFHVRSLTHECMCKIEVCPKKKKCKKGGWCTGCENFFEVGPKRKKCKKGDGCEKGGCKAVLHLGAKIFFRALRARTHLNKNPVYAPLYTYEASRSI